MLYILFLKLSEAEVKKPSQPYFRAQFESLLPPT